MENGSDLGVHYYYSFHWFLSSQLYQRQ